MGQKYVHFARFHLYKHETSLDIKMTHYQMPGNEKKKFFTRAKKVTILYVQIFDGAGAGIEHFYILLIYK